MLFILKNMSGCYLNLGQGITIFEKLYGIEKCKNIKKVANYFKTLIKSNYFDKSEIKLLGKNNLSKEYEYGTIISKYYDKRHYNNDELIFNLKKIKEIYDNICETLKDHSYMTIVNNLIKNFWTD